MREGAHLSGGLLHTIRNMKGSFQRIFPPGKHLASLQTERECGPNLPPLQRKQDTKAKERGGRKLSVGHVLDIRVHASEPCGTWMSRIVPGPDNIWGTGHFFFLPKSHLSQKFNLESCGRS